LIQVAAGFLFERQACRLTAKTIVTNTENVKSSSTCNRKCPIDSPDFDIHVHYKTQVAGYRLFRIFILPKWVAQSLFFMTSQDVCV
jgi:hypothetical protein